MKIAIVFLLAGLSGCFGSTNLGGILGTVTRILSDGEGDDGGLKGSSKHLSMEQGNVLACLALLAIDKHESLKKSGMQNSDEKMCYFDMIKMMIKVTASFKKCDFANVVDEMLNCGEIPSEDKMKLRDAFKSGDITKARGVNADNDVLDRAVLCILEKFISPKNLLNTLKRSMDLMSPVIGSVLNIVGTLVDKTSDPESMLKETVNDIITTVISTDKVVEDLTGGIAGGTNKIKL